jgi:ectoine hydroxylase-related dioxygenase (phytanoyl-CoA dioxygenase family)
MLTAKEIKQYQDDGYIVPDFRLSDEILAAIRFDQERLFKAHPEFQDYCPNLLAYDLTFLNYARIPEIVDMVDQLIGPDFALWNSSLFAKPAGIGRETPWHQDGEYWPIRPVATCTVWMAIDASTPENGCLRVIRGSHKDRQLKPHNTNPDPSFTLNQELAPDAYDEADAVDIILEAGQMSLHDVYLLHGSEANKSGHSRRGMTLRYMPLTSHFDRDLAAAQTRDKELLIGHESRTLYLMRGRDVSGLNDFQMRL